MITKEKRKSVPGKNLKTSVKYKNKEDIGEKKDWYISCNKKIDIYPDKSPINHSTKDPNANNPAAMGKENLRFLSLILIKTQAAKEPTTKTVIIK